jgi:geranylgeranyl pyrophosphate synthase
MKKATSEKNYGAESILNSPYRAILNDELKRILLQLFPKHPLIDDLFYHLRLDTPLCETTVEHSKRLRGILCLLIANGIGADIAQAMPVACALELYHNASLILDDIEDDSSERCGRPSLWCKSGISQAINAAFLLKTTAEMTLLSKSINNEFYIKALHELISTTAFMSEGQTYDLQAQDHWQEGMDYYYKTARLKTGSLLGIACKLGTLDQIPLSQAQIFQDFGINLGFAHQMEDDFDDLIAINDDKEKILDTGNVAFFMAAELGLLNNKLRASNGLGYLLKEKPELWQKLNKNKEEIQQRLQSSLEMLKSITSLETHRKLSEITNILCTRNDCALQKIFIV